jgi:hypothetical protein
MTCRWLLHLGVDFRCWGRMRRRGVPSHLAYSRYLGGAVISGGGDKRTDTTHETGLPLSGSPLVSLIPSFHPTTIDVFVVAHIPLVRGGALRGPSRRVRVVTIINRVWLMMD